MAGLGFFWPAAAVDGDAGGCGNSVLCAGDVEVCFGVSFDAFFSGG